MYISKKDRNINVLIPCACNCGQVFLKYDKWGYTKKFIKGHKHRGKNNYNYKGEIIDKSRYILVFKPEHPYCDGKGYVRKHRLVMEQFLGRYLTKDEVVHHKDHNGLNNDISNLELFDSNKEHMITIHRNMMERNEKGQFVKKKLCCS